MMNIMTKMIAIYWLFLFLLYILLIYVCSLQCITLYMYLCMNIIIDGKYALCMQACAPLTGGSEQWSRPPCQIREPFTLEYLQVNVKSVWHNITSGLQGLSVFLALWLVCWLKLTQRCKVQRVRVDRKCSVNIFPLRLAILLQSSAALCLSLWVCTLDLEVKAYMVACILLYSALFNILHL